MNNEIYHELEEGCQFYKIGDSIEVDLSDHHESGPLQLKRDDLELMLTLLKKNL